MPLTQPCEELSARTPAQVVQSPLRFARKFFAGHLLNAKMFGGQEQVDQVLHHIKTSSLWDQEDTVMKRVVALTVPMLQQWVRGSVYKDGVSKNERFQFFCASVVKPCMRVSLASIPENLELLVSRMTLIIQGGAASEEDAVKLKMACNALRTDLETHPVIAGLSLACARMTEKNSRGIWTLVGRPSKSCTEREKALLSDAGMQLALASANVGLARSFGLGKYSLSIKLDQLFENSLPTAPLAIRWPDLLKSNFELIDQRFERANGVPHRYLDFLRL